MMADLDYNHIQCCCNAIGNHCRIMLYRRILEDVGIDTPLEDRIVSVEEMVLGHCISS